MPTYICFFKIGCIRKVYAAASALLAIQKVPIKMAGVSLAKSLFVAEGQKARDDLKVEEMEPRMKSQVSCRFSLQLYLRLLSCSGLERRFAFLSLYFIETLMITFCMEGHDFWLYGRWRESMPGFHMFWVLWPVLPRHSYTSSAAIY